jgi:hypothetical protein
MDSTSVFTTQAEDAIAVVSDTVEIHGTFDGFPIVYRTHVNPNAGLNIELIELTTYLREMGVEPRAGATIAAPAAPQNPGASRDVWNDGSQQPAASGFAWQTCGHGQNYAKMDTKFNNMRCTYKSETEFPGSNPWQGKDGWVYFCKAREGGRR